MPAMTLTEALLLAAALVLAGLAGQGWWRLRKVRPRPPAAGPGPAGSASGAENLDRTEPSLEPAGSLGFGDGLRALRRAPRIDALIDAIVPMVLESPVSGEAVLAHLPSSRRAGTKPFIIEGRDMQTGDWAPPQPDHLYTELQAGIQLANRNGALNQIEYSEFVQKVQAFADALGAAPDFPDMREVVARARELDALTSPLDAQLGVTLRSNSVSWSVGYLQQIAARHGFVAGALPGRLVVPGAEDGAPPVLVLSFDAQAALDDAQQRAPVRECTLSLDVPQTPRIAEPFPAWHAAARGLTDDMDAILVDDTGQPVTLHAFASIGQDLQILYDRLDALDLPAGSPAARRLFS